MAGMLEELEIEYGWLGLDELLHYNLNASASLTCTI